MNLDETQRKAVTAWIEAEWGLRQTYLEVRLLVDDLKLTPKDPVPPPVTAAPAAPAPEAKAAPDLPAGKVSVAVDQITRAGAMASGKVRFSDGKSAEWLLDQMGRLSLAAIEKGYKPSAADIQEFQIALQDELQRLG